MADPTLCWKDIPGFFNFENVYREAVAHAANGARFVEIGVMFGCSAAFMAAEIKASGKQIAFDAIDMFGWELGFALQSAAGFPHAEQALRETGDMAAAVARLLERAGVADRVRLVQSSGQDWVVSYADASLDLVFIDARHTYEDTKELLSLYLPKIKEGGVLAGHDYDLPGVERAVKEILGAVEIQLPSLRGRHGISFSWEKRGASR